MSSSGNYLVPIVNHFNLRDELMSLFLDTFNNDQSIFCLISFKQFIQANYVDEDIRVYYPCLYKKLFMEQNNDN